ncbi:hypothetical protein CspeluHIS016_0201590 [Cutaneotrichosporon spelunceum]|uniref:Transcription initiation factor TFIID subunit 2 n=1 Tax=Cutaneotrichosporon spelunceum TaxID=1672016 RepID=A0AAD3YAJ4_9TREE|nr:hypothetical protein CspeluHIS016_0201590 [Cutaneotrichosporon spelunceum]
MADDGGRGFTLYHQRNVIEIDFAGALHCTAHLTIQPTNPQLRTVFLHASPLIHIGAVTLSSPTEADPLLPTPATFNVVNPFQPLPVREPPIDLKSHQEIKRKTWAALGEKDEGELAISVSHGWVRLVEEPQGEGVTVKLAPIQIQIDYSLVIGGEVTEGIVFRRPGDGGDESQIPHMFLSPTTSDAARIWTPCVDSLWERCTWELEFIVPRYIEGGEPRGDNDSFPTMVIASGELEAQSTHPHDPHKVIFYYIQTTPASVQHITFAAGPFEMLQVPAIQGLTGSESQKPILGFCLPGQLDELATSTSFLPRAMCFYGSEFGSFPFSAYKMVFVSNPRAQSSVAVTMCVFSSDLLHPANVIDQAIETRQHLSLALIQQWVGVNIIQRTLSDTWLITGLALYLHSLFIRHLFGNNEYRFRLRKDMDRCANEDQGDQLPLCMPGAIDPPSAQQAAFMSLKAPLVLYILDRHIAKSGTNLGLSRVIPRIFLASLSDELPNNMLSTSYFFRLCRKVSGMDLLAFVDQWVYGSGCPVIAIRTNFIRKKFLVEFTVEQSQPAFSAADTLDPKNREKVLASRRPTPFFEGSLTVRIHEADGAPFEHLVDLKTNKKTFPLPFNTKYKRTRRSGHVAARFSKLQDALAQAEDNDEDQEAELRDLDRGEVFAYPPWEDEEEQRRWRVHDWSEEEAQAMLGEGGGYEWIRVDPDLEWLAKFEIHEKPWFWISQLQGDRDVVAQLQAIQSMSHAPSPVVASELARTVLVDNYFYRVRMEAARALVAYNTPEADYMGGFCLMKLFHTFYCQPTDEEDPTLAPVYPLPNDFSNFPQYFLKKSMITAMLISAIGSAFTAGTNTATNLTEHDKELDAQLLRDAMDANERAITVDRLVPSYHNVVTMAGLQAQMKSILVGQRTNDPRMFLHYTREGNYEPLRIMAFDCLLLCKSPGRSQPLAQYLFHVIRYDYSLTVRRHVARAFSESILMTLAVGEVHMSVTPGGIVEVTDNLEQREKERDQEQAKIVKAVRKSFNPKPELREELLEALTSSFTGTDREILFALIKAAEIISSTTAEPKPGAIIKLQTPVTETPTAAAPKIRFNVNSSTPADQRGPSTTGDVTDYGSARLPPADAASPSTSAAGLIKLVLNNSGPPKDKKKKKKHVPKAQTAGLSDEDFKAVTHVLAKLHADKRSAFFRHPVDPVRDHAPDYTSIVKRPMDLMSASAKFESGQYATRKEFENDIRLIVSNCYLYNPVGSPVRKAGEAFEHMFDRLWKKTERTLNASSGVDSGPASPKPQPAGGDQLMPPPPVPGANGPKIKLKQSKSVTIDTGPAQMAPPPIPKKAASQVSPPKEKEKPPKEKERPSKEKEKPAKKKKVSMVDDLLGAELDLLEGTASGPSKPPKQPKSRQRSSPDDELEDLLGNSPPPAKKIKLNARSKAPSSGGSSSGPASMAGSPAFVPRGQSPAFVPRGQSPAFVPRDKGDKSKPGSSNLKSTVTISSKASVETSRHKAAESKSKERERSAEWDGKRGTEPPKSRSDKPRSSDAKRGESSRAPNPIPEFREALKKPEKKAKEKQRERTLSPARPPGIPVFSPPPPIDSLMSGPIPAQPVAGTAAAAAPARTSAVPPAPVASMSYVPLPVQWPKPPADLAPTVGNTMPFRQRRAKAMIQVLIKDPAALYFLRPVDPIRDGCPTYYDEIKHPSDYQSIMRKIDGKKYRTMGEMAKEIELIFANCRKFNPPGPITDMAATNEELYWKEWARAVNPRMTPDERKVMLTTLNRAFKEQVSFIFREPVDPVKLGIPQYFEIIPQEEARDLSLIRANLERGKYQQARQVDDDFELMLENARVFNGDGPITDLANQFGQWWKAQRGKMEA